MKRDRNPAFEAALRELGHSTTPEELRRRGVRKVFSIGKSDVAKLIEIAVNRTILARTIGGLSDEDKQLVMDVAGEVFSGDVRTMSDLASSCATIQRERAQLEGELSQLKRHLDPDQQGRPTGFEELDRERQQIAALREQITEQLAPSFEGQEGGEALLEQTVERMMSVVTVEYDAGIQRERFAMTSRVDTLERRISKLMRTLDDTEEVLGRVAQMKDLETGIESVYRKVQGLSPDEADRDLKLDLMKTIFQANLELRGSMAS